MRPFLLLISLFTLSVYGQKLPQVNFNHFYLVIDSSDLSAIQKSMFIKNKFAPIVTRSTKADSGVIWTGTYLFGLDNYFEILPNFRFLGQNRQGTNFSFGNTWNYQKNRQNT